MPKISALPPAATVNDPDDIPILQSNVTKKLPFSVLTSLFAKLSDLASSIGASLVGFIQSGVGAVARSVQGKERDVVNAKDFGVLADGVTNDIAALALATTYAASIGAKLSLPPGIILIASTWVLSNKVVYAGANNGGTTLGTVIKYTGSSDAIQINNPINSSTAANIRIQDLRVICTTRTAGKASIADVGSTFLSLYNVAVDGNDFGIILDQSELAVLDECDFELSSGSSTAGLWLVNGADHTGGASAFFTNRISVRNCQFNGSVGAGIADDGGLAHAFIDNNMNDLATHFRICGTTGCIIARNECEGYTTTCISFPTTKIGGGAATQGTNARICDNVISSGLALPAFTFGVAMLTTLQMNNNSITQGDAGATIASGLSAGVTVYSGEGNTQGSIGADPDATFINTRNVSLAFTTTWKGDAVDPAVVNGTLSSSYQRNGNLVTLHIDLTMGAGTTFGTGAWYFTLPFTMAGSNSSYGSVKILDSSAGTFFTAIADIDSSAPTKLRVLPNNVAGNASSAIPFTWANLDQLHIEVSYPITRGSS